jgi:phage recombination protein Bet
VTDQQVITAAEVQQAQAERKSLIVTFAERYGLEPNRMMTTLKATCFRQRAGDPEITNEQMAALLVVANAHRLNPFTKEIHAFASRGGIVPIVGIDGWAKLVNEHPAFDGMEFEQDDEKCKCTMYRKDRAHPISVTEYLSECERPTEAWKMKRRMLRHKSLIQCARIAFSLSGIYDPDEAERVLAAEDAIDVTPEGDDEPILKKGPVNWKDRPPRIAPKRMRKIVETLNAHADKGEGAPILEIIRGLHPEEYEQVWKALRSWEHTAIKKALAKNDAELEAETLKAPDDLLPWAKDLLTSCMKGEVLSEDLAALNTAWSAIENAYDANGEQPPPELVMLRAERDKALRHPHDVFGDGICPIVCESPELRCSLPVGHVGPHWAGNL